MKGKFLLSVAALLFPVSLSAQVIAKPTNADIPVFQRYEVFGGIDYSSANQVKGSSALIGGNGGISAKLKPWFGATADFGYYSGSRGYAKPTVTTILAGPEFSVPSGNLTGFLHVMFGGAHTSGTGLGVKPDVSFAYAIGGGISYALDKHWSIRATGDGIYSSFVQDPDNTGASAHLRVNPRAMAGVGFRF